ncbi:MAG: type II toxin-antitoxin system RelE/ParE family toxin [Oryzomonas sp.]|nr:type II toxin-antitoxin system RelE/ParE family toxin [Oryzomonas sp.]MDR3578716.1 type II toxin-antitoxin system RelE/ParE family toxin [Oryzomonas sp.]
MAERLQEPRIESARLSDTPDCYKIKLRSAGFRLVYQVFDDCVLVVVIAVGKRENNLVYRLANERL